MSFLFVGCRKFSTNQFVENLYPIYFILTLYLISLFFKKRKRKKCNLNLIVRICYFAHPLSTSMHGHLFQDHLLDAVYVTKQGIAKPHIFSISHLLIHNQMSR
jgi:hypothetical protein